MSNRQPPKAMAGSGPVGSELADLEIAIGSATSDVTTLEPLQALDRLDELQVLLEAYRFQLVRSARVSDNPWSRIAEALDRTEEQAEADFGKVDQLVRSG